jgi:hypothetical protein
MDISGVSTPASAPNAPQSRDVATEVQKKALEISEQTASDLIAAIPDPNSPLGQNIDVKA